MQNNFLLTSFLITILLLITTPLYTRDNSTQLYEKAVEIAKKGDIDASIEAFKEVIKVSPNYSLGHYGLGKTFLYKDGMLEEAIKHLELSVQYDRSLAKGYFYLGIAYMLSKKYQPAIKAFSNAYKHDSERIEALYNIGAIYEILENKLKSEKYYKLYLQKKNSNR